MNVIDRPLSNGSRIYAILNAGLTQYKKIGSTRNFRRRLARYVEAGFHPDRFRRIFDLNVITEELDARLQDIYQSVLAIMENNDTLHEFHQFFRELLEERQGERLGPKKQIIFQLIESGFQLIYGLPGPQEFVMMDRTMCHEMFLLSDNEAKRIVQELLDEIVSAVNQGEILRQLATSSWVPNHTGLSCNRV